MHLGAALTVSLCDDDQLKSSLPKFCRRGHGTRQDYNVAGNLGWHRCQGQGQGKIIGPLKFCGWDLQAERRLVVPCETGGAKRNAKDLSSLVNSDFHCGQNATKSLEKSLLPRYLKGSPVCSLSSYASYASHASPRSEGLCRSESHSI